MGPPVRLPPLREEKIRQKYAVDEVQVPDQCGSLWQAIQRAIASNGKIKTVCGQG